MKRTINFDDHGLDFGEGEIPPPQTGDATNMAMLAVLLFVSAAAIVMLARKPDEQFDK